MDRLLVAARAQRRERVSGKSQIYAANVATGEIRQLTHRNGTNGGAVLFARRQADRLHVGRLHRSLGVGGERTLWVMNADGSDPHRRVGQPRPPDLAASLGRRQRAACASTSRAKVQRTCISRRQRASSIRSTSGKQVLTVAERRQGWSSVSALRSTPDQAERHRDLLGAQDGHRIDVHAAHRGQRRRAGGQGARADRKRSGTRRRTVSRSRAGS